MLTSYSLRRPPRLCGALTVALAAVSAAPAPGQDNAAVTGVTRSSNPAISSNALFVGVYASDSDEDNDAEEHAHAHGAGSDTGLRVQEVEIQLTSIVDPYLKADLILAVPGGEGIELEEGYVTTQRLPFALQLRAGRLYAELGRHNRLHAHQQPFLDAPLVHTQLLGEEGLADDGVSLSWLTPLPAYVELTGQVFDGRHELFASQEGEDLLYVGHARAFWEPAETATVELGASSATGKTAGNERTTLRGADMTWKWRSDNARHGGALVWQSEYLRLHEGASPEAQEAWGLYTSLQYQWSRRWWAQARWGLVDVADEEQRDRRASALIAFVPSEFSSLRLQYTLLSAEGEESHQVLLQLNVTIGSHPAHRY